MYVYNGLQPLLLLELVLQAFLLLCPCLFPLDDINWKSKIKMMNSIFFQTSCGFLVDSPVWAIRAMKTGLLCHCLKLPAGSGGQSGVWCSEEWLYWVGQSLPRSVFCLRMTSIRNSRSIESLSSSLLGNFLRRFSLYLNNTWQLRPISI